MDPGEISRRKLEKEVMKDLTTLVGPRAALVLVKVVVKVVHMIVWAFIERGWVLTG